uniref:Uncharacterized protein n=1 Tax=Opuntia streptacantha TaxID=393608 RepID=A0A7C8YKT3_OPUST
MSQGLFNLFWSCRIDGNYRVRVEFHPRNLTHLNQLAAKPTSSTFLYTSREIDASPVIDSAPIYNFLVYHIPLTKLWQMLFLFSSVIIFQPGSRKNSSLNRRWLLINAYTKLLGMGILVVAILVNCL